MNAAAAFKWKCTDCSPAQALFATLMIALGALGFIYGDFATVWQRIPIDNLPGRQLLAYLCAAVELFAGVGLLVPSQMARATRILALFSLLWMILLRLPAVLYAPQVEATWLGFGEIGVIFAGAWTLWCVHAAAWDRRHLKFLVDANAMRAAQILFALCLPMIGLSHFFYAKDTADFVPSWVPFHLACAYLTGTGSIAASIALLLGVFPRLAATLEAAMLGIITLVVWGDRIIGAPTERLQLTGIVISAAIACGAWLVAESYRDVGWLSVGRLGDARLARKLDLVAKRAGGAR